MRTSPHAHDRQENSPRPCGGWSSLIASVLLVLSPLSLVRASGDPALLSVTEGDVVEWSVALPHGIASAQWTLERVEDTARTFVEAQTRPHFLRVFEDPGSFVLTLLAHGAGGETIHRSFPITVDALPLRNVLPLRPVLATLPRAGEDGAVSLPARGGTITVRADASEGDISAYRLDLDASLDADGDGRAGNDVDNADHSSLQSGAPYVVSLRPRPGETERAITLTVVSRMGQEQSSVLRVLFQSGADLLPVLRTVPVPSSDGVIRLPVEGGVIRFDAGDSEGLVHRYDLDLDGAGDRDGDGDALNDRDSSGTIFSRTGQPWTVLVVPREGELLRVIRLTVSDREGRSRSLDRTVVFAASAPPQGSSTLSLLASPEELRSGAVATLRIVGATPVTRAFAWDSAADGAIDRVTTEPELSIRPDAPGVLRMRVILQGSAGEEIGRAEEVFTVLAGSAPAQQADVAVSILAEREGEEWRFQPVVEDVGRVAHLDVTWSLGDGTQSHLFSPIHRYEREGVYDVKLVLIDPATGATAAQAATQVSVAAPATPPPSAREGEGREGQSLGSRIARVGGTALLGFVLLAGLVGGLFLLARLPSLRAWRPHSTSPAAPTATRSKGDAPSPVSPPTAPIVVKRTAPPPPPPPPVAEEKPASPAPPPTPPPPTPVTPSEVPPWLRSAPLAAAQPPVSAVPPPRLAPPPGAPPASAPPPLKPPPPTGDGVAPPWLAATKPETPPPVSPLRPLPLTPPSPPPPSVPPPIKPAAPPAADAAVPPWLQVGSPPKQQRDAAATPTQPKPSPPPPSPPPPPPPPSPSSPPMPPAGSPPTGSPVATKSAEDLERIRAQKRAKRQRYRENVKKRRETSTIFPPPPPPTVLPPPSDDAPIAFIRAEGVGGEGTSQASDKAR